MSSNSKIRVVTYADVRERELAETVRKLALAEVSKVAARHRFHFEEVVDSIDGLAAVSTAAPPQILLLVGHASESGRVATQDIWFDLKPDWRGKHIAFDADVLADMLQERPVRVALILTCFGARIAEALVDRGVADVAAGTDTKLGIASAVQFARGFFRSLALGRAADRATRDGQVWARARQVEGLEDIKPLRRAGAAAEPLLRRPDVHIIGSPATGSRYPDIVAELTRHLEPHPVFHIDGVSFGAFAPAEIDGALETARMIIVLFDGERIEDAGTLEQVHSAVAAAIERGDVRLFPLYLRGTRPSRLVPFGLRRLTAAFVDAETTDDKVASLAIRLEKLL